MSEETNDLRNDAEHCCGDHCDCGGEHCAYEHEKNQENGGASNGEQFDFSQDFELPKPTLITLATTLAQQAMVSMGILPNPITGKSAFMMNQATHLVDTVELIFEKTAGNRTEEETKILENIVHELRMLFVAASNEKSRRESEKK